MDGRLLRTADRHIGRGVGGIVGRARKRYLGLSPWWRGTSLAKRYLPALPSEAHARHRDILRRQSQCPLPPSLLLALASSAETLFLSSLTSIRRHRRQLVRQRCARLGLVSLERVPLWLPVAKHGSDAIQSSRSVTSDGPSHPNLTWTPLAAGQILPSMVHLPHVAFQVLWSCGHLR